MFYTNVSILPLPPLSQDTSDTSSHCDDRLLKDQVATPPIPNRYMYTTTFVIVGYAACHCAHPPCGLRRCTYVSATYGSHCLLPPWVSLHAKWGGFVASMISHRFSQIAVLAGAGQILGKTDGFHVEAHEACDWARLLRNKKVSNTIGWPEGAAIVSD